MSINELIRDAVLPIVPICEPDSYEGDAAEYCTFHYSEFPTLFADGTPDAILYSVMLHWFLPRGADPTKKKAKLRRAIFEAGCTYPSTINASDNDAQHYVFEFQYADGDV